jgi:chromosome segregation ATPase
MNTVSGSKASVNAENLAAFLADNTTLDQYVKAKEEADVSAAQAREELGALASTKANLSDREAKLEQRQNECNIALSKIQAERADLDRRVSDTQNSLETQGNALNARQRDLDGRAAELDAREKKIANSEKDISKRLADLQANEQRIAQSQADLDERIQAIQRAAR